MVLIINNYRQPVLIEYEIVIIECRSGYRLYYLNYEVKSETKHISGELLDWCVERMKDDLEEIQPDFFIVKEKSCTTHTYY